MQTIPTTSTFRVIDLAADRLARELRRQRRELSRDPDVLVVHSMSGTPRDAIVGRAIDGNAALVLADAFAGDTPSLDRAVELAVEQYGVREVRIVVHPRDVSPASGPPADESGDRFSAMRRRMSAARDRLREACRRLRDELDRLGRTGTVGRALADGRLSVRGWVWVEQSGAFSELDPDTGTLRLVPSTAEVEGTERCRLAR